MSIPDSPQRSLPTPHPYYVPPIYPKTPGSPPAPPPPPLSVEEVQQLTAIIGKEFFTDSLPKK